MVAVNVCVLCWCIVSLMTVLCFVCMLFKLCFLMHVNVVAFCCGRRGFPLFYLSCLCGIRVVVSCVGFIAVSVFA